MGKVIHEVTLVYPDNVCFEDLRLRWAGNSVDYCKWPILSICEASEIPAESFLSGKGFYALLLNWYMAHLQSGGRIDLVAEAIISQLTAHKAQGDTCLFAPGHA